MSFEPSLVRQALDELLERHPHFDLVSIRWQVTEQAPALGGDVRESLRPMQHAGPWVLVTLGQPSETWQEQPAWALWRFAIWKTTGAVHTLDHEGAVSDDPILTP